MAAPVYDDQKSKTSDDELRQLTGISPDEEQAMDREAHNGAAEDIGDGSSASPEELGSAEADGSQPKSSDSESKEAAAVADNSNQIGEGLKQDDDGRLSRIKNRLSKISGKKKAAGAGGVAIIVTGAFGIFSILQGPFQVVQFAKQLTGFHFTSNEDFSDSRTGKFFIYLATLDNPNRRNLGIVGNKAATKYNKLLTDSGIEMRFDHPTQSGKQVRRIQSMDINSDTPQGKKTLDALSKRGVSFDIPDGGIVNINLRGDGSTALSRNAMRAAVDSVDLNKISGAMAKRLLIRRARVDFHPLRNKVYEKAQETLDAYRLKRQQEASDSDKNGARKPDGQIVGSGEADGNGDGTIDESEGLGTSEGEIETRIELDAAADVDTPGKLKALRLKYANLIKAGGIAAAGVGLVCAARGLGDQAEAIEYANIVLPLMRTGMRIVATGNQVMSGQGFNIDELGAISDTLYGEKIGSWAAARSIQAENGQELTGPDINDDARPSKVGEKPLLFQILSHDLIGGPCGVNDAIGRIPVLKQVGDLSNAAIDQVLGIFGWNMSKLMTALASLFAGGEVEELAQGALLGNYANYGARLAANDSAISKGGRVLTGTEMVELKQRRDEILDQDFKEQSFFAQLFSPYDTKSVVGKAVLNVPRSPTKALASAFRAPFGIFSIFTPKAQAQTTYDYGFPLFGFSLSEQEDERLEDPMENADVIEPILAQLNARYDGCFNTVVDPDPSKNGAITIGDAIRYDEVADNDSCSEPGETFPDGTTELLRYRMYIADMVTAHTLSCYEGNEESCRMLGFGPVTLPGGSGSLGSSFSATGKMLGVNGAVSATDADRLAEIHANTTRSELGWNQGGQTFYDANYTAGTEPWMTAMAARGVMVLPLLNSYIEMDQISSDAWANSVVNWCRTYCAGGAFWAGKPGAEFAPKVLEIFNEPFGGWWNDNTYRQMPIEYARLLKATRSALNAAGLSGIGILGAAAQTGGFAEAGGVPATYNQDVKDNGGYDAVQGVTLHPYGEEPSGWANGTSVKEIHDLTGKDIYITEYGICGSPGRDCPGGATSEDYKSQVVSTAIQTLSSTPWLRGLWYYALYCYPENTMCLDGNPAYSAFQQAASGGFEL